MGNLLRNVKLLYSRNPEDWKTVVRSLGDRYGCGKAYWVLRLSCDAKGRDSYALIGG